MFSCSIQGGLGRMAAQFQRLQRSKRPAEKRPDPCVDLWGTPSALLAQVPAPLRLSFFAPLVSLRSCRCKSRPWLALENLPVFPSRSRLAGCLEPMQARCMAARLGRLLSAR